MILIPQKLFDSPQVKTILRDGNICILKKSLTEPVLKREGYISNHVISIVLSGEQRIRTYEDKILSVKTGEVIFIPRGLYYVSDLLPAAGNFESLLFYFDDRVIQDFLSNTRLSKHERNEVPEFLKFGTVAPIKLYADALLALYEGNAIRNKSFLNLKIQELLSLLNSLAKERKFAEFLFRLSLPSKRNIKSFMEKNFAKPLKIEDYAYLTGRSMSTFRRDFKSHFQMTPQKWLKNQRMEKAIKLLNSEDLSVSNLAFEVGYENVSYFIKEFKIKTGLSPKQYALQRKKARF